METDRRNLARFSVLIRRFPSKPLIRWEFGCSVSCPSQGFAGDEPSVGTTVTDLIAGLSVQSNRGGIRERHAKARLGHNSGWLIKQGGMMFVGTT